MLLKERDMELIRVRRSRWRGRCCPLLEKVELVRRATSPGGGPLHLQRERPQRCRSAACLRDRSGRVPWVGYGGEMRRKCLTIRNPVKFFRSPCFVAFISPVDTWTADKAPRQFSLAGLIVWIIRQHCFCRFGRRRKNGLSMLCTVLCRDRTG